MFLDSLICDMDECKGIATHTDKSVDKIAQKLFILGSKIGMKPYSLIAKDLSPVACCVDRFVGGRRGSEDRMEDWSLAQQWP